MRKKHLYILLVIIAAACKEEYDPPFTGPPKGYLVVDGVINSGAGPTTIRLSRTVALADSNAPKVEQHAQVFVEGENNTNFFLYEVKPGVYESEQLELNAAIKYRLHIYTIDGKEYISDYAANRKSPPVDDITWTREVGGVQLHVNTHDPQNNTWYYKWDFEETWEFHSKYIAIFKYLYRPDGTVFGFDTTSQEEIKKLYTCWASETNSNILIGSSAKLSRDTIDLPLTFIPQDAWKMSVLYSINVKQYSPSPAGYDFFQRVKKNTEQVGGLFDAQPSQLVGNIHCANAPDEMVIGYVDVAEVQQKRVFISRSDVSPWNFQQACDEVSVSAKPDSLNAVQFDYRITSVAEYDNMGNIKRLWASHPVCVDCSLRGTNEKPSFWP